MVRTKVEDVYCKIPGLNFLPQFKIRNDKLNIAKISVSKLSKIVDPQSKLRKAVLINNTLKSLQKYSDLWHLDSGGGGGVGCGGGATLAENNDIAETEELHNSTADQNNKIGSNKCEEDTKNTLSEDMLTLYDDIVNDIFGSSEENADISNQKDDHDKENVIDNYKETYLWSPYSYNSFLSELYTVSNNEKLQA